MTTVLVVFGVVGLLTLVGVVGTRSSSRGRLGLKSHRAIEGRETTGIGALQEGQPAKIRGVVAARGPLLTSPIGGHSCIGYRANIDEPHDTWAAQVLSREVWQTFLVTDGTGTVAVEGRMEVLIAFSDGGSNLPPRAYELLKEAGVRMKDLWGPRRFAFQETLLKVGDRVSVAGRPSRETSDAYVMRGSWEEPVVVADDDEPVGSLAPRTGSVALLESEAPRVHGPSRREIERRETTAIAALREGELARIEGVVAAREPLLTSPVSGAACIGYRVLIERMGHGSPPVVRREAWPSFLVADDTGKAAVQGPFSILLDPDDGGWATLPPAVYALLEEANVPVSDLLGRDQEFQFKETLLKVGDRVGVLGRPVLEIDPAGRGSFREPPQLHVLRGSGQEPVAVIDVEEPIGVG